MKLEDTELLRLLSVLTPDRQVEFAALYDDWRERLTGSSPAASSLAVAALMAEHIAEMLKAGCPESLAYNGFIDTVTSLVGDFMEEATSWVPVEPTTSDTKH